MDQGLFGKYQATLLKRNNLCKEISVVIEQETGVLLQEEELVIEKNKIKFQTSSVKKMMLQRSSIKKVLEEKGYIVLF